MSTSLKLVATRLVFREILPDNPSASSRLLIDGFYGSGEREIKAALATLGISAGAHMSRQAIRETLVSLCSLASPTIRVTMSPETVPLDKCPEWVKLEWCGLLESIK